MKEPDAQAIVDGIGVSINQRIVVAGEAGNFYLRGVGKDGSLTLWGGLNGHEAARSFSPDRCHLPGWRPANVDEDSDEKVSRASRYSAFEMWASAHRGEVFSTQELADTAGFSTATMLKYLSESLLFEKMKKGQWRILNTTIEDDDDNDA